MEINKQAKYEGYIWHSDQTHPQVLRGKEFDLDQLMDGANPFVIEGQLWDAEQGISISIRNVDGKHIVNCQQVTPRDLLGTTTTNVEKYIPHRIEGVGRLCFLRYWKAEGDELCEHFKALRPEKLVFIGFENLTNKTNKED
jgi:CRISPR type III-associated protein (TIGR04423 family)